MDKANPWILPICFVVGLGAFGAAFFLLPAPGRDQPPAAIAPFIAAAPNLEKAALAEKDDNALRPPLDQDGNDPSTPPARRNPILQRITAPSNVKPDRFEKTAFDIHDLAINADATRLITKSKKEVICWDLTNGQKLQTFLPPKPAWDYMEPDARQVWMSDDTRFVATLSVNKQFEKSIEVREADSNRTIGRTGLAKEFFIHQNALPAFTPAGEYMLLPSERHGELCLVVVSMRDGKASILYFPTKEKFSGSVDELAPVPNESTVIMSGKRRGRGADKDPSAISSLDLQTGKETPITSLTNSPWHLFFERGVDISADGRYVLAAGINELQVSDWRANRQVFSLNEKDVAYLQPRFTPDGKRFMFMRQPQYDLIYFGGPKMGVREHPPCTLVLYDLLARKKISEFTLTKDETFERITALAISRNGKVLAIANRTSAVCLDFEATFGVAPLAPLPRPTADVLPAK